MHQAGMVTDNEKEEQLATLQHMIEEYNESEAQKGSCFLTSCCFKPNSKQVTLMHGDRV